MMNPRKKGWTLVEALVASAILALALGMMYRTYFAGNDLWQVNTDASDLRQECRRALAVMTGELKKATRTSALNPSPNLQILSANEMHFYLPADLDGDGLPTDSSGAAEWDTNNRIKYQYIPGQRELRRLEKGETIAIARDVSDARFIDASIDPGLPLTELRIILTLEKKTRLGRVISYSESANVKLRN